MGRKKKESTEPTKEEGDENIEEPSSTPTLVTKRGTRAAGKNAGKWRKMGELSENKSIILNFYRT